MNENRNTAGADSHAASERGCERAEEFVAYLYGEATPGESKAFRQHLYDCAVCREELATLGGVREAFGAWRAEALGSVPSLDISEALKPSLVQTLTSERKRSASAALREFFSLAPMWLRAGAFAATLAVCALAALTLARTEVNWDANGLAFRTGVAERIVREQAPAPTTTVETAPAPAGYTEEQVEAIVARRVAEVEAQLKNRQAPQVVNVTADTVRTEPSPVAQSTRQRRPAARPKVRRDEPLIADEDNLPRLSDLLDGSY